MAIFYHIVEGDPLNSSGNSLVIEGAPGSTIEGDDGLVRNQAFVGHHAWCDACKSAGPIVEGPGTPGYDLRMYDHVLQAYEAVEGDIVVCKCERPPRVIAVHGRRSRIDTYSDSAASAVAAVAASSGGQPLAKLQADAPQYDDRYVLRDGNHHPMPDTRYTVQRPDGQMEYGTTDAEGHTHLLATTVSAERIRIYVAQ